MKEQINNEVNLVDFSKEHLYYEIAMFVFVSNIEFDDKQSNFRFLLNMKIEVFVIHLRNLVNFLYPSNDPRKDDVVANNFFSEYGEWEKIKPSLSDNLDKARKRAHKEVGHITTKRVYGQSELKVWDIPNLSKELINILRIFSKNADRDKLDQSISILLEK